MAWKSKFQTGQRFNRWTLISRDLSQKRPAKWLMRCDCGNEYVYYLSNIVRGKSTQCQSCADIQRSKELIGKKFNHLLILKIEKVNGKAKAKVKCDCGNEKFLEVGRITNGAYKSCGICTLNRKTKEFYEIAECLKLGAKRHWLTIIKEIDEEKSLALCACGKEKEVKSWHMRTKKPSCGCYWKNLRIEKAKRYIGFSWGKLTCIEFIGMQRKWGATRANYRLKCKCGNFIIKDVGDMFAIRSCGCFQKESVCKGENNYASKTNNIEIATIRELHKNGSYSRKELAEMMGLKYEHVCAIIKKTTWKHVK